MTLFETYLKKTGVYGKVKESRHPLVYIEGLPEVRPNETIIFENDVLGQVLDIEPDAVHALVFSNTPTAIHSQVTRTGQPSSIAVGPALLSKTISPLGIDQHTGMFTEATERRPIFIQAPGIDKRNKINKPFLTGVTKVDLLLPLGKGQRELILGDVKTGKTSLVLSLLEIQTQQPDTIIVYAAIGKRRSEINQLSKYLLEKKLDSSTVIVASSASDSPSIIYLTPYSAMTIAEYFRDQGKDVVLILDDLSTHAQSYREISLLSRRFPGRESYPGDIFYAHASLLERAGNFKHKTKGSVAITCLPIATIVEGDLTGYISTNLMGMTDGHILFDVDIYNKGQRPAINIPLSVTRVGRQTQTELFRSINVEILSTLSQYTKIQNIAHLGSELSSESKRALEIGQALSLMIQQEKDTIPRDVQVALFGIVWNGMSDLSTNELFQELLSKLLAFYESAEGAKLLETFASTSSIGKF
ncbi:hypothetical protein KBD81_05565, partial [Candidatus Woesebacteria bacterium]|nr:hypothetical protein [Candidatus Woesebacteria bacterium]